MYNATSHGSFRRDKGSTPWWKVFQKFMTAASLSDFLREANNTKTCDDEQHIIISNKSSQSLRLYYETFVLGILDQLLLFFEKKNIFFT